MIKNVLVGLLMVVSISACNKPAEFNKEWIGHWISKSYIDSLTANNDPQKAKSTPFIELIFQYPDSNLSIFHIGNSTSTSKYLPIEKNKIEIKNYLKLGLVTLEQSEEELILKDGNGKTVDHFIKISEQQFEQEETQTIISYGIAYVNKLLFTGSYLLNDTTAVNLQSNGQIIGLKGFVSYAPCLTGECHTISKRNNMFLTNNQGMGMQYDWEIKKDSLLIYELDMSRFPMKTKLYDRKGLMFALKKIN